MCKTHRVSLIIVLKYIYIFFLFFSLVFLFCLVLLLHILPIIYVEKINVVELTKIVPVLPNHIYLCGSYPVSVVSNEWMNVLKINCHCHCWEKSIYMVVSGDRRTRSALLQIIILIIKKKKKQNYIKKIKNQYVHTADTHTHTHTL